MEASPYECIVSLLLRENILARNWYRLLGLGLTLGGVGLAPVSYFLLRSVPLVALGVSIVILGAVCLALGRAYPKIPPGMSLILMEAGLENIAAMLEELGLRSRAVYLPSSLAGGKPQALMPLGSSDTPPKVSSALPRRLIVKYGTAADDMGLLVAAPGSAAIGMLDSKPGPTPGEIEAALVSLLVGKIDAAGSVSVFKSDEKITVQVSDPRLEYRNTRLHQCLGSPLASIVASIASEALNRPLIIASEHNGRHKSVIELEVVGEGL